MMRYVGESRVGLYKVPTKEKRRNQKAKRRERLDQVTFVFHRKFNHADIFIMVDNYQVRPFKPLATVAALANPRRPGYI